MDILDRIVSISTSHYKAIDSGQMSLFGAQAGLVEKIELPGIGMDVSRRELLNWERDLIGLYVSDHPLSPVMDAIRQNITHSAAELGEAEDRQIVRVAGLITHIRPHTTKKGDAMAFASIEDFQGAIDLVIFPRTYSKYQQIIRWDNIIMVDGKVDNRGAEPKVLVDHVTTELDHVTPLNTRELQRPAKSRQPTGQNESQSKPSPVPSTPGNLHEPTSQSEGEIETGISLDWEKGQIPPPPDVFPDGWEEANGVAPHLEASLSTSELTAESPTGDQLPPKSSVEDELVPTEDLKQVDHLPGYGEDKGSEPGADAPSAVSVPILAEEVEGDELPAALPPLDAPEEVLKPILPPMKRGGAEDIQMITVILRPRQDKTRDKLLLRRIFGLMICQPGEDRFAFQIFEHGKGHLLEFPNLTPGICSDLVDQITELVGAESIRIEPITFL